METEMGFLAQGSANVGFLYLVIGLGIAIGVFAFCVSFTRWLFRINTIIQRLDEIREILQSAGKSTDES